MDYYGYWPLTGGTDTNIMVSIIKNSGINARTLLNLAQEVNIIFNGVWLPDDNVEFGQGGIWLGTNVISSRGYQPEDCREIAWFINELIKVGKSLKGEKLNLNHYSYETQIITDLKAEVNEFASKFPFPGVTTRSVF